MSLFGGRAASSSTTDSSVAELHAQAREDYENGREQRDDAKGASVNATMHAIEAAHAPAGQTTGGVQ